MKERLQLILSEKKLSASRFAEIMDVQPSSISHLLSGRNNPNSEFIIKLLNRFPDVNPDWFLLGKGSMMRTFSDEEKSPKKELPLSGKQISILPAETMDDHLKEAKRIEKVIVFYTDRTFTVYTEDDNKQTTSR